jgi:hypothetical protein
MTFVVDAWAANKSASAQKSAGKKSLAEQKRQFDLTRSDQMPWMQAGSAALGQMQALNNGDFSKFYSSPDYQFALEQGMQGLDRSAAARGRLFSGGYGQDLTKYAQGMATQNYGNYYNRLAGLSGTGQTTATNLGQIGQNYANAYGNIQGNIGNARASAYQGYANALNGTYDKNGNRSGGMFDQIGNFFGGG